MNLGHSDQGQRMSTANPNRAQRLGGVAIGAAMLTWIAMSPYRGRR